MKRNQKKKAVWLCIVLIFLLVSYFSQETEEAAVQNGMENVTPTVALTQEPENPGIPEGGSTLEVHYLDIGQGDATLLVCDGEAMLIDAGENDKGTQIQNYLTHLGIEELTYVIGTHPHSDHIGGMDVVIYKFDCENILMPDHERDNKTYKDVINAVEIKDYEITVPEVGDTFSLGSAQFQIVAPNGTGYESINDYSIALLLTHGENTFLFTGDAQETSEKEMLKNGLDIDADVYQVGHHGSYSSSSERFLKEVTPEYAVISCGEGNDYGHPHAEVMNRLRAFGVEVFRTDEQGTIVATSVVNEDGSSTLTWNAEPSDSWLSGR